MTRPILLTCLASLSVALTVSCGREAGGPARPSAVSFLEGRWTGTLTIERPGAPTSSGPVTWTFTTIDGTNRQSFTVTIESQHAWLAMKTTVNSAITPGNTPPARISTQGDYPSPRGCTGTLLSVGTAEATSIDADFSGVDCSTLAHSTFAGRVQLTKATR